MKAANGALWCQEPGGAEVLTNAFSLLSFETCSYNVLLPLPLTYTRHLKQIQLLKSNWEK